MTINKPLEEIDGSEVREMTFTLTAWVEADIPLSEHLAVLEKAAIAASWRIEKVKASPPVQ